MTWSSLAASALLLTALTACADNGPDGGWPTADPPVDTAGLVWASGETVHLADGSTIDTDSPILQYVVGGAGVWFTPDDATPDDELPELMLATAASVTGTGAHPVQDSLTTSADGRWLAFLDRAEQGTGPAETVVVDLTTGEELVRSSEGVVTESDEDWADLYGDEPISVAGILDDTLYVFGLSEAISFRLPSGASRLISKETAYESAWLQALRPGFPRWNRSHSWSIADQGSDQPHLVSEGGEKVTSTRPEESDLAWQSWTLDAWLDEETAVGFTASTDADQEAGRPSLIVCKLPTGDCDEVEGTEAGVQLPRDRRGDALSVPVPSED